MLGPGMAGRQEEAESCCLQSLEQSERGKSPKSTSDVTGDVHRNAQQFLTVELVDWAGPWDPDRTCHRTSADKASAAETEKEGRLMVSLSFPGGSREGHSTRRQQDNVCRRRRAARQSSRPLSNL